MRFRKLNWLGFAAIAFLLLLASNYHFVSKKNVRYELPVGNSIPQISLAATHGLIVASDGSLWSWGSDFLGWPVLGYTDVTNQTALRRIGHDNHWASVSAGTSHNLAITAYGTLWGWGENLRHQLNDSLETSPGQPVPCAQGSNWRQASAGGSFSLGLKKDGTLWSWGDNWAGQLGIGTTNNAVTPTQVGTATNWTKIWAGNYNSLGLQSDGSLWWWGDNPTLPNQLPRSQKNLLSPARVSPDTNWIEAAFASQALLALKSDGTLWVWGRYASNYTGVLNQAGTPTRLGTNSDWQSISSSESARDLFIVLRKRDNSLWTMQAVATVGGAVRVTQVPLPKEMIAVAGGGGGEHGVGTMHDGVCTGVGLTRDGEVWVWGRTLGYSGGFPGLQGVARLARQFHVDAHWGDPHPITPIAPELLPVVADRKN